MVVPLHQQCGTNVNALQCSWESPSVYCLTYKTDKDMERKYLKVDYFDHGLYVPKSSLKDKVLLAKDKKNNIMECKLLRVETIAEPKNDYEDVRFTSQLVLNVAGKGIVRVHPDAYKFYEKVEDIYTNKGIGSVVSHLSKGHSGNLEPMFGKVTSLEEWRGLYEYYVSARNFVWDEENMRPRQITCYIDTEYMGMSLGYGDDYHIFPIKPDCKMPLIYAEDNCSMWVTIEDRITHQKIYRTFDECVADNSIKVTRFEDSDEAEKGDCGQRVEFILI